MYEFIFKYGMLIIILVFCIWIEYDTRKYSPLAINRKIRPETHVEDMESKYEKTPRFQISSKENRKRRLQ